MTIVITKTKLAIGILAMVLIGATTALAVDDNPFDDVPDSEGADAAFYSGPVEWLWDNSLTTGSPSGSNTFKPLDNVTRGEYATFNFRYDENVVQPLIEALQAEVDALEASLATTQGELDTLETIVEPFGTLYWASINADGTIASASNGVNTSILETQGLPAAGSYEVDFEVLDVGQCHVMASLSDATSLNVDVGQIFAEQRVLDPSSIFVKTTDSDGVGVASPFTVQLWCSPPATEFLPLSTSDAQPAPGTNN